MNSRKLIVGDLTEEERVMASLHRSIVVLQQEVVKSNFHETCLKVLKDERWNDSESSYNKQLWIVTSFGCHLQEVVSGTLKLSEISKFEEFLRKVQPESKQLLILKMEDYTEER